MERGLIRSPDGQQDYRLRPDWDWHRLAQGLAPNGWWEREVRRMIEEDGFQVTLGSFRSGLQSFSGRLPPASDLREIIEKAPPDKWFVFQLHYPMTPAEVEGSAGADLVAGMLARLPGTDAGDEPLPGRIRNAGCGARARYLTRRVLGNWARQPNQKAR